MVPESNTGIEVRTGFLWLAFLLYFCKPRIEIDGETHFCKWGTRVFDVKPGKHKVTVWFKYLWWPRCGENSIEVNVNEGEVARVSFWMPPWVLMKGRIRQVH